MESVIVPGLKKDTSFTDGRRAFPRQAVGAVFDPPSTELDPTFDVEAASELVSGMELRSAKDFSADERETLVELLINLLNDFAFELRNFQRDSCCGGHCGDKGFIPALKNLFGVFSGRQMGLQGSQEWFLRVKEVLHEIFLVLPHFVRWMVDGSLDDSLLKYLYAKLDDFNCCWNGLEPPEKIAGGLKVPELIKKQVQEARHFHRSYSCAVAIQGMLVRG